jgi:hypothetical protein
VRCTLCQSEILAGTQAYTLRIDLFAGTDLEVTEEELFKDRSEEFEQLIDQLEKMDAEEISEEADKVFERYTFTLCPICRARFHGLLRALQSKV